MSGFTLTKGRRIGQQIWAVGGIASAGFFTQQGLQRNLGADRALVVRAAVARHTRFLLSPKLAQAQIQGRDFKQQLTALAGQPRTQTIQRELFVVPQ